MQPTTDQRDPARAIVAGVRAAIEAFPASADDTPYDRAKRATAAIAEAGLELRDALESQARENADALDTPWWGRFVNESCICLACGGWCGDGCGWEWALITHAPDCAAIAFDAAVRAAVGEAHR